MAQMTNSRSREPYHRARELLKGNHFAEAFAAYEELARAGDVQSQIYAAWMLHEGHGILRDKERALSWFERAATLGSKEGAFYCGRIAFGRNDYEKGLRWFRQAAAQEYGPALLWLGLAHVRGLGVATDRAKGIRFLERAADTGNFFAKRELALMMIRGEFGVLKILVGLVMFPWWAAVAIVDGLGRSPSSSQSDRVMG